MRFKSGQNLKNTLKMAISDILAIAIIVFALADISVLQAYHGNETLGIPAEHHQTQESNCAQENTRKSLDEQRTDIISRHGDQHEPDGGCAGEAECLAGCSHSVIGFFVLNTNDFPEIILSKNSIIHEETDSKSAPSDIFHPPQKA